MNLSTNESGEHCPEASPAEDGAGRPVRPLRGAAGVVGHPGGGRGDVEGGPTSLTLQHRG